MTEQNRNIIYLKNLDLNELTRVINLYPWYGAARKELCKRMMKIGGGSWGKKNFANAAMYAGSGKKIADLYRTQNDADYSDKEVEKLVKALIYDNNTSGRQTAEEDGMTGETGYEIATKEIQDKDEGNAKRKEEETAEKKNAHIAGGDYFSRSAYEKVKLAEDNIFSRIGAGVHSVTEKNNGTDKLDAEYYTETLAKIYIEQGYFEEAKDIYSSLLLKKPEKNAYFASLIEKLDELINI